MRRIAVINQKGGVGKTTTTANLGAALAEQGRRVALVDMDAQGNLSLSLGVEAASGSPTSHTVLIGETSFAAALRPTAIANVSLVPSNLDLSGAELEIASQMGREFLMRDALKQWEDDYRAQHGRAPADYVLFDCPPSLGLLSINALAASGEVLITLQTEFLALQGMSQLVSVVQLLRKRLNPELVITGILPCLYESRVRLAREVLGEIKQYFPGQVFPVPIRSNVKLAEAPSFGQTIFQYAPDSIGAMDYRCAAREVLRMETRDKELADLPPFRNEVLAGTVHVERPRTPVRANAKAAAAPTVVEPPSAAITSDAENAKRSRAAVPASPPPETAPIRPAATNATRAPLERTARGEDSLAAARAAKKAAREGVDIAQSRVPKTKRVEPTAAVTSVDSAKMAAKEPAKASSTPTAPPAPVASVDSAKMAAKEPAKAKTIPPAPSNASKRVAPRVSNLNAVDPGTEPVVDVPRPRTSRKNAATNSAPTAPKAPAPPIVEHEVAKKAPKTKSTHADAAKDGEPARTEPAPPPKKHGASPAIEARSVAPTSPRANTTSVAQTSSKANTPPRDDEKPRAHGVLVPAPKRASKKSVDVGPSSATATSSARPDADPASRTARRLGLRSTPPVAARESTTRDATVSARDAQSGASNADDASSSRPLRAEDLPPLPPDAFEILSSFGIDP